MLVGPKLDYVFFFMSEFNLPKTLLVTLDAGSSRFFPSLLLSADVPRCVVHVYTFLSLHYSSVFLLMCVRDRSRQHKIPKERGKKRNMKN